MNPIIIVVGARPNFMKMAPLYQDLKKRNLPILFLHTGQHYDRYMSDVFFEELGMPEPDIYLGIGSGSHAEQTAKIMIHFEKICVKENPLMVVVAGDVNSTIACALVASKLSIPVAHVEAGLRSYDRYMPEEINRVLTDQLSDLLLTPSLEANQNLIKEGISKEKIYFVGNIMIDTLLENAKRAETSKVHKELNVKKGDYALLTMHRPSNVDEENVLSGIINALEYISKNITVVFPAHPRTSNKLKEFGLYDRMKKNANFVITEPKGYLDFLALIKYAKIVLTDSGGLQEETTALGVPCLTLRENTERPITVEEGTNKIIGSKEENIKLEYDNFMIDEKQERKIPDLWDGKTAKRIGDVIEAQID